MRAIGLCLLIGLALPLSSEAKLMAAPNCSQVMSDSCKKEFQKWDRAEQAWRVWKARWGNFIPMPDGRMPQPKKRPVPPAWLQLYCAGLAEDVGPADLFCQRYQEALEYNWLFPAQPVDVAQAIVVRDVLVQTHSWFARHAHYELAAAPAQSGIDIYGFGGFKTSVSEVGRLNIYLPGVLVTRQNIGRDGWRWQPALTVSIGYRLGEFNFPRTQNRLTLFGDITAIFLNSRSIPGLSSKISMVTLSMTARRGK